MTPANLLAASMAVNCFPTCVFQQRADAGFNRETSCISVRHANHSATMTGFSYLYVCWINIIEKTLTFHNYCCGRCRSRIWSRRPQFLRPKVADAKWSHMSEVSYVRLGSRAHLRAHEAFGFLMLKYAFFHILETLFSLIFNIYFNIKS